MGSDKTKSLPWLIEHDLDVSEEVRKLVKEYIETRSERTSVPNVGTKTKKNLQQDFKNAKQGRTKSYIFNKALAAAIGIPEEDIERSIIVGPMKKWKTAVKKQYAQAATGTLNDLGRSRILIKTIPQYTQATQTILATKSGGKGAQAINVKDVEVFGVVGNYLNKASKFGYAGSINADIKINLGKGRFAISEIQIMPEDYVECYEDSHVIYEMIRILDTIPKYFKTPAQNAVCKALVNANSSLFFEYGMRSGFIEARDDIKNFVIDNKEYVEGLDILDRIRTELTTSKYGAYKRPPKWFNESLRALSYANTSLTKTFIGTNNMHACALEDKNEHG